MDRLFQSNPLTPPERFYKSADGILHLARTCDSSLLETACNTAIEYSACTYAFMKKVLITQGKGLETSSSEPDAPSNSNTRGKNYYI